MRHCIAVLLIVAGFSTGVHAEGGCPPGQAPSAVWAPTGSPQQLATCTPFAADTRVPKWHTRWGAFASDENGPSGVVTGVVSEPKAEKKAMKQCKKNGGNACEIVMTFRNQCAAVVANGSRIFLHRAPEEDQAVANARKQCEEASTAQCWVHYSGCSLAVWGY